MTENEFNEQFSADDLAEIESALAATAAEAEAAAVEQAKEAAKAKPVKDGLWYVEDGTNGNGHTISWYRLVTGGKTLLWFSLDNDLEAPAPKGLHVPPGVTVHTIRVHNATRTASIETTGVGARAPHKDGTGVHIDGQTVRQYVAPRVPRWIAEFYAV
jgi:hypothetical protein